VYGGEICSHRSPFFHDPTVLYLILICSGVLFRRSQCLPPCSVSFIAKMKIHVLDMGNAE
ncbi:hypothetical protein OFO93_42815, partial [Escherichia coli]|nr:hypothetical protein [Escherichia coli]